MPDKRPALFAQGDVPRLVDLRHTSAFRLTAAFGAVFVLAMVVVVGLIYVLTADELSQRIDGMIALRTQRLIERPQAQLPGAIREVIKETRGGTEFYALLSADGRPIVSNMAIERPFPIHLPFDRRASPPGLPLRLLALRAPSGELLVVGRDFTAVHDLRDRVLVITGLCGAGAILVVVVAGLAFSLGPIRRIQRLHAQTARIAAGELGLRLPVSEQGDELDLIANIINGMVEEIERLMAQVKGATDAIAHDMRTPLTHLRARLDRIALHPAIAPVPELRGAMFGAIEQLDAALARFRALLRISEIEASRRQAAFAPLDPLDMLAGVSELYEPLAEERGISLWAEGEPGLTIQADETLLFEAISNLVENAIKFAPGAETEAGTADTPSPTGRIVLAVTGSEAGIAITVTDNGPGIAPEERERVLRRFERGAGAATAPGSGLGLSLVVAIVHIHGFRLSLESGKNEGPHSTAGGLTARIEAPRLRGPAPGKV